MRFDNVDAAYTFSREVWLMIHLAGFLALALSIVILLGEILLWRQYEIDRERMKSDLVDQKWRIDEHIRGVRHRERKAKKQAVEQSTEKEE